MITYIKIDGFKSFRNFEMEFTPLTVVAGANASGKSNLFDALKLISRLAETDNLKKAFNEQRGEFIELFTQYDDQHYAKQIKFEVEMLVSNKVKDGWGNKAQLKYTRLRYELLIRRFTNDIGLEDIAVVEEQLFNLKHQEDQWIKLIPRKNLENWRPKVTSGRRDRPYIFTELINDIPTVIVPQDGVQGGNKRTFPLINASRTVLSSFDTVDFPHILAAKEEMRSWKFLQLNPEDLRQPSSKQISEDKITASGKNLAAALYRIKQLDAYTLTEISRKLNSFLPDFTQVDVFDEKENKQYVIKLRDKEKKEFSSRVLSEGTLRLLALCILEFDDAHKGLLCFEEPENGIHPFRLKSMVELLKDLSADFDDPAFSLRQVIINTHSPSLVALLRKFDSNINVSVFFSSMRSFMTNVEDKRYKINISKILPVDKNDQLQIDYSDQDKNMTLAEVKKYLQSPDAEKNYSKV